jgi:toxin YoeB
MRDLRFTPEAFAQYIEWEKTDRDVYSKINKLLVETARNPFQGIGKPEPLKHELKGYWSRRITSEHRLIYRIEADYIKVVACKLYYQ